jgi:hypothetical protein
VKQGKAQSALPCFIFKDDKLRPSFDAEFPLHPISWNPTLKLPIFPVDGEMGKMGEWVNR